MTSLHDYLSLVEGPPTPSQFESYVYFMACDGFFAAASVLADALSAHYKQFEDDTTAWLFSSRLGAQAHVLEGASKFRRRAA